MRFGAMLPNVVRCYPCVRDALTMFVVIAAMLAHGQPPSSATAVSSDGRGAITSTEEIATQNYLHRNRITGSQCDGSSVAWRRLGAIFWECLVGVGQKLVRTCQAELKPIDQGSRFDAESEKLCAVAGTRAAVAFCFPSFNCAGFTYGM